ncbi:MAG TPA: hypothetical protein PLC07_07695 [Bacillota bacterium]|nr:hypothetical protein [Bacillota bacterium]HPT87240.1 hypothetical protein [Bacillota bacterium]
MAKLYFRYEAMNAGKTTQLLQVKYNFSLCRKHWREGKVAPEA